MYVCLCYGLSEKKIKELIKNGAATLNDLQDRCSAGKSCGSCVCQLKELLTEPQDIISAK